MVKDDGEAVNPKKTLDTLNPDGKSCIKSCDGPSLPGSEDSQIGKEMEIGARVSADGGDDMSVTLAELSSKRGGKRGAHQLKDGAQEASSKHGDLGLTDEKIENTSVSGGGDDSVILRRSRRKKIDVDSGVKGKKLKLKEGGEKEKEEEEQKQEDEDEDEDESEFSVGDFVWGKVKSHPWWPGRVFDPSDASQQALKYKHEGRILVAYFGDATFAWCDESQLKPFVENFAEMSKQSGSKNFLNAVEEAVTEFGRLVELDMTCYCTPRSEQSAHHQGSGLNAGIKGGVNVNKGGIGMYSVDRFNPAAFLDDLRVVGTHASVNSLLELTTLRSWVSAVYRPKDGSLLLKYNEMQEAAEDEGVGAGMEDSIRGAVEESVQVLPGMPAALVPVKRKERSVAEILYGDEKANEDGGVVDEGEKSVKTDSKSVGKKRKVADENEKKVSDQEESLEDEILINQSVKRKKKLEDISKGETETVIGDKPKDDKKVGSSRSSRMKAKESPKPIVVQTTDLTAFEESEMTPRTRERKKSKYLSPPYTNLEYYRQTAINSPRGQAVTKTLESSNLSQSGETSSKSASGQVSGTLVKCSEETSKKNLPKEDGAENGKPNGSAPDTPRRASSRKVGGNTTKSIASSNNVLSGIRSAALTGQLSKGNAVEGFVSSYRSSKYQNESTSPCEADDQSGGKGESSEMINHEAVNDEKKNLKKSETKREKAKLRSKGKVVDSEKDEGNKSLKKSTEKSKLKNKGKEVNSETDDKEERKSLKKSEANNEKAKLKNKAEEENSEKDGNITGATQSAALHLKFPAGYPLPSKDDLGALYGKFGELDTTKTRVIEKSSSVRLVFLRDSDAEAACKSSKESSPFGAAEVSYRVRLIKATSNEKEVDENGFLKKDTTNSDSKKRKRSNKKQSKESASDGGLGIVKQKLEGMATMVAGMAKLVAEAGDGKVSSELKLNLEGRVKDLLEEVKVIPAFPSSSGSGV